MPARYDVVRGDLIIVAAVVALISIGGLTLYFKGGKDNQRATDLDNAKSYIEGTKDATDAKTDLPDTDAGIVEWLLRPWD